VVSSVYRVSFEAWGYPFSIEADCARDLQRLLEWLPSDLEHSTTSTETTNVFSLRKCPDGLLRAFHAGRVVGAYPDDEVVLQELESFINVEIASHSPSFVFVHAGVVEWKGKVVVLPGRSFAGKSDLTKQLVDLGATYYSDEYALIDESGSIHPYSRALSLRRGSRLRIPAQQLNGGPAGRCARVGAVVVTKYQQGTVWQPRTISAADAVWALFHNSVSARLAPDRALTWLPRSLEGCQLMLAGNRGEALIAAQDILTRLDRAL
jgi:hypothetical protein